jgi:uncharacterized LabA/DUF88 family protein
VHRWDHERIEPFSVGLDSIPPVRRAAFYLDGFNVYHSLDELREPHLKWLSWQKLSKIIVANARERAVVERIVFCTAPPCTSHSPAIGIASTSRRSKPRELWSNLGYFLQEEVQCRACAATWRKAHEKEGDVSLALALIDDAYQELFDIAFLVTNDGDQAPTVRLFRERFGQRKDLVSVSPDWLERGVSRELSAVTGRSLRISRQMVAAALFGPIVYKVRGERVLKRIVRPPEYDPPRSR